MYRSHYATGVARILVPSTTARERPLRQDFLGSVNEDTRSGGLRESLVSSSTSPVISDNRPACSRHATYPFQLPVGLVQMHLLGVSSTKELGFSYTCLHEPK